jgi:hypothetical protein
MSDLDARCMVCHAKKGDPCRNPCTGVQRPQPCIGRLERRAIPCVGRTVRR